MTMRQTNFKAQKHTKRPITRLSSYNTAANTVWADKGTLIT